MKRNFIRNSVLLGISMMLILSCQDSTLTSSDHLEKPALQNIETGRQNGYISKPFKSKFFTSGGIQPGPVSVEICGDPPLFYNVQEGYGEATHLGRFTIRITFCVDASDLLDDGALTEGESIPYFSNESTEGYMQSANGDKLYITIEEGKILPSSVEGYAFMFMDPFAFTGGTGRFEGASGGGMTQSLVIADPERTDHLWNGRLNIPK